MGTSGKRQCSPCDQHSLIHSLISVDGIDLPRSSSRNCFLLRSAISPTGMISSYDWDSDRVGCIGGRHRDSGIRDGTVAAVRDHRLRNRPRPAQFCRLLPLDSRLFRAGALLGAGVAGGSVRYSSRDPTTISFLDRLGDNALRCSTGFLYRFQLWYAFSAVDGGEPPCCSAGIGTCCGASGDRIAQQGRHCACAQWGSRYAAE